MADVGRSALGRDVAAGAIAGAAGTTALYVVTYLDMAVRGRSESRLPERTAGRLAETAGIRMGEGRRAENRRQAIGALLGILTGVGLGAAYGALGRAVRHVPVPVAGAGLGFAATMAGSAPTTVMGLTDPRTWGTAGWVADLVPHTVYGLVTAYAFALIPGGSRSGD